MQVQQIPVSEIVVDAELNPRVGGVKSDHVTEMKEWLEEHPSDDLPPAVLYRDTDEGDHLLSEGFHRHAAYSAAGRKTMPCEVRDGNRAAALLNAAASNQGHGLKRSPADKRRAAELVLHAHPEWADRRIADHVGVSNTLVGEVRAELESSCQILTPETKQGKDGKSYPAKPQRKSSEPVKQPTQSQTDNLHEDTPKANEAAPAPANAKPAAEPEPEPEEEAVEHPADVLVSRINRLCLKLDECKAEAVQLAKETYGGHIHPESVEYQIASARKALWQARPTEPCKMGTGINGTDRTSAARVLRRGGR